MQQLMSSHWRQCVHSSAALKRGCEAAPRVVECAAAPGPRTHSLTPTWRGGLRPRTSRYDTTRPKVVSDMETASALTTDAKDSSTPAPTITSKGPPPPLGYAALFGVALLWGSYTPSLKFLFMSDHPPSAALLNALQAVLSALFLAFSSLAASIAHKDPPEVHPEMDNPLMAEAAALASWADADAGFVAPAPGPAAAPPAGNFLGHKIALALNWRSDNIVVVGAELGLYMCLAFGLEVLGVQLISATKTAFLNQATVLITPLLVHLSGEQVKKNEWGACGLGLVGSLLVAADGLMRGAVEAGAPAGVEAADNENALGFLYVLLSAVFFAMSTVRLGRYSTQFPSLKLASASTFGLALFSLAWVVSSIQGQQDGLQETGNVLLSLFTNPTCLATLVWVGIGPGALAAFLQASGQQSVPPAQAQIIYATTPLWAVGFAMLALNASDEAMGSVAWVGAGLMLGASLLASLGDQDAGGPTEDKQVL